MRFLVVCDEEESRLVILPVSSVSSLADSSRQHALEPVQPRRSGYALPLDTEDCRASPVSLNESTRARIARLLTF